MVGAKERRKLRIPPSSLSLLRTGHVLAALALLVIVAMWLRDSARDVHRMTESLLPSAEIVQMRESDENTTPSPPRTERAAVINLARRPDRWSLISRELQAHAPSLNVQRIDAVDGHRALNLAQMVVNGQLRQRAFESAMNTNRRVWGQEVTRGAIGCLLSHAKAWELAAQLNKSILVLEDDVQVNSPHFELDLSRSLSQLPFNFGLMYLADMARDAKTIHKSAYSQDLTRISRPLWGTYAYVISPVAARRLLFHMYPIDTQVDSYIQQVAQIYEADMPHFVSSSDLVSTDNSETRDTDAQVTGEGAFSWSQPNLRYHVLLDSGAREYDASSPPVLTFDATFGGSLVASSRTQPYPVTYHTEEAATLYAGQLGMSVSGSHHVCPRLRRWLLCVAVAVANGGGLCFADTAYVARSIQPLLEDSNKSTELAVFMASASTREQPTDDDDSIITPILSSIVYASVGSTQAVQMARRIVADGSYGPHQSRNDCADHVITLSKKLVVSFPSSHVTFFPPHIFDPTVPLQRPCHCSVIDRRILGTESAMGCQSRCDRMVAPVYAGGFIMRQSERGHSSFLRVAPPTPNHLHILALGGSTIPLRDLATRWKTATPAGWTVNVLGLHDRDRRHDRLKSICKGFDAVARSGGVYIAMDRPPKDVHALLDRLISAWTLSAMPHIIVMWRQGPTSQKRLGWRFLASPFSSHPVVTRLAKACNYMIGTLDQFSDISPELLMLQLQQVVADDATAVRFVIENDVF